MLRLPSRHFVRRASIVSSPPIMPKTSRSPSSRSSSSLPPGYAIDPTAPPMLRFQSSLPNLPVPSLSSTAEKYLETVRPHIDDTAFAATRAAVAEFIKSPLAADLQNRLETRAKEEGRKSWLSDWWNDVAYMGYRDPVVVFVSYFYVHVDEKLGLRSTTPAERGARLIKGMLAFREMTETQQLEPEKVRGAPLCMESYQWLFHSSRYPTKPSDTAAKFDWKKNNHIVFLRKNRFFFVDLATAQGTELTAAELEIQIERIIHQADSNPGTTPIGALTADNRDLWTNARNHLLSVSKVNAQSLEKIESSMIVVCLDSTKPITREDISWSCWVGDGRNRFYDKHQVIIFDNGRSGFLGEHSCMDGTPTLRMNEFVLAALAHGKIDLGPARAKDINVTGLPEPVELKFVVNDDIKDLVKGAEERFDKLVGEHELQVLHYSSYGKSLIKKFKASPDAWAQLVKHLAFYKMFNRLAVTYESAQTRKYQLGRTEVIRSASNEVKEWVESMGREGESDAQRAALFRAAVSRHSQYTAWAVDGQGVDRHLFGLKKIFQEQVQGQEQAQGKELPALYQDPSFAKTSHWELSTSQLSSDYFDGWGYGEVVPDGYGLSYAIGDEYIRWTITSIKQNRDSAKLKQYLAEAATEVRGMMENAVREAEKGNEIGKERPRL